MGEIADEMDGACGAFDQTTKRGITHRIDAGRDEIEQPVPQRARRLELTALDAADGRLGYGEQLRRMRLLHAAVPADKP
jgi:hypothetical protein